MTDHFFSSKLGDAFRYDTTSVTVATSTTSADPMEFRVTDAAVTAEQCYAFLEKLADFFATRNTGVVPTDMLTG